MKLSVNVDHIASIREARRATEPDPVAAAVMAELSGCDGITIHLRSDRRHIKDRDLELLRKVVRTRLNLEMGITQEMMKMARKIRPDQVTLVPESPEEVTTEGGLDLTKTEAVVRKAISELKEAGIEISIFIEPELEQIEKAKAVGADIIEVNTAKYTEPSGDSVKELERIRKGANHARSLGLRVHAGHGLNYLNVQDLKEIEEIEEVSIGHSIIANAALLGIGEAVKRMKEKLVG
ncbi:pyridoxine 5'-phosphate synthase [candidate division TA06 bacterium DG_26]|uniref:Pyridoxine 5'-phosphate synthase n=1 Tax=candidate division TA06 bacterium DG_26 TaxID=1703771 RepID=A0A0S7WK89_UNCT6|nr:MAG: pyridoxine 5'-phosphate synthase [candidate division TA06 bacterium DG_26]